MRQERNGRRFARLIIPMVPVAMGVASTAQANLWNNGALDNDFANASNWDTGLPDSTSEDAVINMTGSNKAIQSTGSFVFRALRVGQGAGTTGMLDVPGGLLSADATTQDRIGVGGGNGTVNQSGGEVRLSGSQVQIGLDNNSVGVYNLTGGTFLGGRETTGMTLYVGDGSSGNGNGTVYITEDNPLVPTVFRTRAGVRLAHPTNATAVGLFHVKGSGIDEIGIGSHLSVDGQWLQYANGTLRTGIDAGGITPIFIDDVGDDGGGTQGNVMFASGAKLDPYNAGGASAGVWYTVMTWQGTLTNNGLALTPAAAADSWQFRFQGSSLQVMFPEPAAMGLLAMGAAGLLMRRRK